MAAYVIATVEVTDPDAYAEYRARVLPTIERHGGRFLVRGGASEILEGSWQPSRVVVLEFPDAEAARRWYGSEDYAPLVELRQRASVGHLLLVEGV
jgi:uncharacterized protein (DUF1330 family)